MRASLRAPLESASNGIELCSLLSMSTTCVQTNQYTCIRSARSSQPLMVHVDICTTNRTLAFSTSVSSCRTLDCCCMANTSTRSLLAALVKHRPHLRCRFIVVNNISMSLPSCIRIETAASSERAEGAAFQGTSRLVLSSSLHFHVVQSILVS